MAISYATLKVTLEVIVEVEHDADGSDNIGATLTEAVSEAKSNMDRKVSWTPHPNHYGIIQAESGYMEWAEVVSIKAEDGTLLD